MQKVGWQVWLALIGGVVAVIGQFWGDNYFLPLIGGLLAVVAGVGGFSGNKGDGAAPAMA